MPSGCWRDDENDPISAVTERFDVTASIACDAASVLSQEQVQEMFQDALSQGGQIRMFAAAATSSETDAQAKKPKPNKNKHKLPGSNVLFEFACDKISNLGTVGSEHGVKVYRLWKEDIDLEGPESIEQLFHQVKALPGSHGPSRKSKS